MSELPPPTVQDECLARAVAAYVRIVAARAGDKRFTTPTELIGDGCHPATCLFSWAEIVEAGEAVLLERWKRERLGLVATGNAR